LKATVRFGSELLGDVAASVISIDDDAAEIVLRTSECMSVPHGAIVTVHFPIEPEDEIMARCRVVGRFDGGLVLEVIEFDTNLPLSLPGSRVLH
jgi:hypothetical protein